MITKYIWIKKSPALSRAFFWLLLFLLVLALWTTACALQGDIRTDFFRDKAVDRVEELDCDAELSRPAAIAFRSEHVGER